MRNLLLMSVGPVQDFISAARRGRDLWFGSWLLSELSRAAALAAAEALGLSSLIMPSPEDMATLKSDTFNVSNKILVELEDGHEPKTIAARMEAAVRARLLAIAGEAFDQIKGNFDHKVALAQVKDLLEISWSAVEVSVARPYADARQLAEVLLAASKSHRNFNQPSWGNNVPKSSLDGQRESVIPERAFKKMSARDLRKAYGVGKAERLCGVGLMKRHGAEAASAEASGKRVVSTSHLASWSMRRVYQDAPAEVLAELRRTFLDYTARLEELEVELTRTPDRDPVLGNMDGHLLFESRMRDELDGEDGALRAGQDALKDLLRSWRRVASAAGLKLPSAPSPYFAILIADGDKMGAALNELRDAGAHRKVTQLLESFASQARGVVQHHHGHLVFAGGDDVIALLPAQEALNCAKALSDLFNAAVGRPLKQKVNECPTLSVGIAVVHHADDLRQSLNIARRAETYAKQVVGRDAWAVTVDKRSGVPVTVGGKWAQLHLLKDFLDLYLEDGESLPRGLPYDLRHIGAELSDDVSGLNQDIRALLPTMRRLEVERVAQQKNLEEKAISKIRAQMAEKLNPRADIAPVADRILVARSLSALERE